MFKTDFDDFRGILNRCADVFSKPRPSDEVIQTYWKALSDRPIESVRECAERHIRHSRFFPKPFELRPKEEKLPRLHDAGDQARIDAIEKRCIAHWERLRQELPTEKFQSMLRDAYNARQEAKRA